MKWPLTPPLVALSWLLALASMASADRMVQSTSLNTCQADSGFSASLFHVVFTPSNGSATINIIAISSVEGYVVFDLTLNIYGYRAIRTTVNPCGTNMRGLCPMASGKINQVFSIPIGVEQANKNIPGIAYTIPDLDATARVFVNKTDTGESVACVEADFSNGKTVDLVAVKWATAIITLLGLLSAALLSGLGHINAAAHLSANTLSLFGYFQAQAILGLTGVHMPPIAQAWTQDFVWSMGIIRVGWMQRVFKWYQRATGGTPATLFDVLRTASVQVQKRSLDLAEGVVKRSNVQLSTGSYVVYGIQRVAFRARIESTNVFMTGQTFFYVLVVFSTLALIMAKFVLDGLVRQKWIKAERFLEFRNGWLSILKGILFRITLLAAPAMTILCLWEFTQVDSPAEVVIAVFLLGGMCGTLGWAAIKIIAIARRSITMHQNPAYILYADPLTLNTWGFLYIQFRASAYYYLMPMLAYTVVKALFVSLSQHNGTVQAIALFIIEIAALISASVLRPWMDKSTNSFNIAICVMNVLNAIFLFIFTNVVDAPAIVVGVTGVVLFIANAAFSLVLLIMVLISSILVFWRKNPDNRYQFMADDRGSFMKSQTQVNATTELDALGVIARGNE
ncbi:DUF907 domain-containing protein, partial [Thelonectria olida]